MYDRLIQNMRQLLEEEEAFKQTDHCAEDVYTDLLFLVKRANSLEGTTPEGLFTQGMIGASRDYLQNAVTGLAVSAFNRMLASDTPKGPQLARADTVRGLNVHDLGKRD